MARKKRIKKPSRANKFGAQRTEIDGHKFHSKAESIRYLELRQAVNRGLIDNLVLQPPFSLVITAASGERHHLFKYIADFSYTTPSGQIIVEDVKGRKTDLYKVKARMFLMQYCLPGGGELAFKEVFVRNGKTRVVDITSMKGI